MDRSEDTKVRLLHAAGEVFVERGFRAATVREICGRAGTPLGAMNYHFRDKKGLYAAVVEYSHQAAIKKYPPELGIRDGSTPVDKLRAFIRTFLLRLSGDGVSAWHLKLMIQDSSAPAGALGPVVEGSIRPLYAYLVSILRELLKEGEPSTAEDGNEIFHCAMSIVGQCCHYYTGRRVIAALRPKGFPQADIEWIADHITRFSLAGIQELAKEKTR